MRRRDLDKLRRLDPKLASQLEGVLAQGKDGAGAPPETPEAAQSGCEPAEAGPRCDDAGHEPRAAVGAPERACQAPASPETARPPEGPVSAPGPTGVEEDPPKPGQAEGACEERPAPSPAPFVNAEAQAGLPEVPQTLVSTEATPEESQAETWAGYEDDCVPDGELERRRVERAAAREAQRAQDRAHCAQLGFFPQAWFRRHGTGKHVSCEQLELQLNGIERRVGRATVWDQGLSATRTMDNVEAQSFTVRDLGDRPASIPGALRGRYPDLTRTQLDLLRVVITAYMGGALGVYEFQPILASDLGMSERALRYALNGGKDRPPGLIELGLVMKRQTWKRGAGDRPSDHHYLLLQAAPALVEELLPLTCMRRADRGARVPRNAGYTRAGARRRAAQGRQSARVARRDLGEQAVHRSRGEVTEPRTERPRSRRPERPAAPKSPPKTARLSCPAQNADNPVPPPSGEGGLRVRRGKPPSPPRLKATLRAETLATASPPLPKTRGCDSPTPPENFLRDRARALDQAARLDPGKLDVWRRRRDRGAKIPDHIDEAIFQDRISRAYKALVDKVLEP